MTKDLHNSGCSNQSQLDDLAQSWTRMVDCITHDLMTPLVILRMTGDNLEKILPTLLEGYQSAVQNNLVSATKLNGRSIDLIEKHLVGSIKTSVNSMMDFLNLLAPYHEKLLSSHPQATVMSIKDIVDAAVNNYDFVGDERELLEINCAYDFTVNAVPFFMEWLFHHLLRNALHAVRRAKKGKIQIWTELEGDHHTLHFKDTATGMTQEALTRVFSRFFSKHAGIAIPGLGFCRLAMLQWGGEILCDAVNEQYTEYVIRFPVSPLKTRE